MRHLVDIETIQPVDRIYAERDLQIPRLRWVPREVRGVVEAWLDALEHPDISIDANMTGTDQLTSDIDMLDSATRKMVRSESTGYAFVQRIKRPTVYATIAQISNILRVILDQQLFALDCTLGPPQSKDPEARPNCTTGRSILWSPVSRGQLPIVNEAKSYILSEQRKPSPDPRLTHLYASLTGYSDYATRSADITWLWQYPVRSFHTRRRSLAKRTEVEEMKYNIHRPPHGASYDMTFPPKADDVIQNALNPQSASPSAGFLG